VGVAVRTVVKADATVAGGRRSHDPRIASARDSLLLDVTGLIGGRPEKIEPAPIAMTLVRGARITNPPASSREQAVRQRTAPVTVQRRTARFVPMERLGRKPTLDASRFAVTLQERAG
jgi:hypothetical protein